MRTGGPGARGSRRHGVADRPAAEATSHPASDLERAFWDDEPVRTIAEVRAGRRVRPPREPGQPVDPLLRRVGLLTLLTALVIPVAVATRAGDEGTPGSVRTAATSGFVDQVVATSTGSPLTSTPASPGAPRGAGDSADGAPAEAAPEGAAGEPADTGAASTAPSTSSTPTVTTPRPTAVASAADELLIAFDPDPRTPRTAPALPTNPPPTEPPATPAPPPTPAPSATAAPATAAPATAAAASTTTVDLAARHAAAVAACGNTYEVRPGEYWFLLASRLGIRLADLLAVNAATVDTPLYAGFDICLPPGLAMPAATVPATAPVSSAAPSPAPTSPTTNPPAPTQPPTTTPKPTPTTATPTTAPPAPTTTAEPLPAPPANAYSRAQVEAIIREVWPDDLEEEALRIATRESNLIPTVRNWCCVGLFQLYWSVHKSWLSAYGVTSAGQLYDPRTNATAAYALYQRSGGWGPWT